ncbi:MAG: protein kinase [Myxococcales bacterium]|nr:protein kinase [Myxococcales bacterium]
MATLDLGPGTVFGGDFQVVRALRVGGMGAVYVAEQRSTRTLRALKVMQRELVGDASLRERFELEARVGAQIESDHVVQIVGAGVDEATGLPWIAMELLKGMPLDAYLHQRGPRSPGEVRFLFEQLCHALGAAHAQGIVHRDLKPANVFLSVSRMVGLSYVVKVLDFGIAKVLAEAKTTRTAAVGTPLYMAPEQYEAGKVTPATDVWALGLIAFELLTGHSYWKAAKGGEATPAKIMYETCLGELVPASSRRVDLGIERELPPGFDEWFTRCVQRQPDLRFADASLAFASLAAVLGPAVAPTEKLPVEREETPRISLEVQAAMTPTGTAVGTVVASGTLLATTPPAAQTPATRPLSTEIARTEVAAQVAASERAAPDRRPFVLGALVGVIGLGLLGLGLRKSEPAAAPPAASSSVAVAVKPSASASIAVDVTQFSAGKAGVRVEGHLLHKQLAAGVRTETYVMLEMFGADAAPKAVMPVHLSLVIDRSGSMKGARLTNALAAAASAIDHLRDGDLVSVVTFDDKAELTLAPTTLDASSRTAAKAAVAKIGLGGNTCISCGLATALDKLAATPDVARRVLLLSDGEANYGVKDVPGFEKIGHDAQKLDTSITTIGVGLDYDAKSLLALSKPSNGLHYYAANEAALPPIFDEQAKAMASVVAVSTEAVVRLTPGIELLSVLDRTHKIEGNAGDGFVVRVPLGQFTRAERKTVLLKIALKASEDKTPIGDVDLSFREPGDKVATLVKGRLAVPTGNDGQLDPSVETRVKSSETAAALMKANALMDQGKTKEAVATLEAQQKALAAQKKKMMATPGATVDNPYAAKDLDKQATAVENAKNKYDEVQKKAPPAGAAPNSPAPKPAPAKDASNKAFEDAYKASY